jgi:hypothetical protein
MLSVTVYTSRNPLPLILTLAIDVTFFICLQTTLAKKKKKKARKTDKRRDKKKKTKER